jgi:WD40 repeat protein
MAPGACAGLACCWLVIGSAEVTGQPADSEMVLRGHEDAVSMGDFTPDGGSAVTVSFDQTVRLWDVATQAELRRYEQHTGPIFCLAISGDGSVLVTGAQDNTLRVWDLPLGQPLRQLTASEASVNAIALNPDGMSIASALQNHGVRLDSLQDADQATSLRSAHTDAVTSIAYRSDGAYVASGDTGGRVLMWSPYLEEPQSVLIGQQSAISGIAFASNNQQLFTADADGCIRVWQLMPTPASHFEWGQGRIVAGSIIANNGQAVVIGEDGRWFVVKLGDGQITAEFPKLDIEPTAVAQAQNNGWICIGGTTGTAHLLNLNDGSSRGTVSGHEGAINDVAVHADSNRFATCGVDGKVLIWGQPTPGVEAAPLQSLTTDSDAPVAVTCLVFAPDQQSVLSGSSDGRVRSWDINSGKLIRTVQVHSGNAATIRDLTMTSDGKTVMTLGDDNTLRTFSIDGDSEIRVMQHPTAVRAVTISPDNSRVAVACEDGMIRVWELKSGQLLETLPADSSPKIAVSFLSDGQTVASVSMDGSLHVSKTSILRAMPIHKGPIRRMAVYAGSQLVTVGADDRVVMSNPANGTVTREYRIQPTQTDDPNDPAPADAKTITPTVVTSRIDNQRITAGTQDGQVLVWNSNDGASPLMTFDMTASVTAIAYSPDNQKLAVATSEPAVHVLGPSIPGVQPQRELIPHQRFATSAPVTDLVFSADNQSIWVSTKSGNVQQWKIAEIAQRRQLNHGGAVYGVAISRSGGVAVACSADQTLRVWDTSTGQQRAQLRGHNGAVHAVAISPDESFAVSSGADGTLRLWDIVGGRQLKQLAQFDATMYSVAIHPNGNWVAAAGADRNVHVLDLITGSELRTLEGHTDYIHSVSFDRSGKRILSYGYAGHLKIWRADDGALLHESRVGKVGNDARFSPDGTELLLSNGDGTARVLPVPQDNQP